MKIRYDIRLNTRRGRWRRRYRYIGFMDRRTPWNARVAVDVGRIERDRIAQHRGRAWATELLIRAIDHETAHVFQQSFFENVADEDEALAFERAGAWARRGERGNTHPVYLNE